MPFCTAVRAPEPRRRAVLLAVRHPARRPADAARRVASRRRPPTITFGAPAKTERRRASARSTTADAAAVDALPPGSALLVVQRGPNAGSRFLLDTDVSTAGRHPESDIFLDDVTVSRRHAEFRRERRRLRRPRRRQPQRHLRQPRPRSTTSCCRAATRCRSASTGWSSTPATPEPAVTGGVQASAGSAGRGRLSIGEVLAQLREDFPDVTHLQDPVPRGRGAGRARRAPPSGYRKFTARRRRAAALRR